MGVVSSFPFDRAREGVNPTRQRSTVTGNVSRDGLQALHYPHPVGIADLFDATADLFVLGLAVGAASALIFGTLLHSMAAVLHASKRTSVRDGVLCPKREGE